MEHATPLPLLSRFENLGGWQPNPAQKLRKGQRKLLEAIERNPIKQQYNAYLPTGYGKTICSMLAYGSLRGTGRVSRALVVVPSVQQLIDYCDNLKRVCDNLGLEISGHDECGEFRAIRLCRSGEAEIFVTTIQSIHADLMAKQNAPQVTNRRVGYYDSLMETGKWLVVADEHHHYREKKAWGDALNALTYEARLGLSATPLSSRGEPSVIGDDYDVMITIKEAYEEQAIRKIRGHIMEHHVDMMIGEDEEVVSLTTTEIGEDMMPNESIQSWEVRRKVRYCSDYLSQTMGAAIAELNRKLLFHPGQHQMLVFAMSCRHAKHVSDMLNSVYGNGYEPYADWIGTGPDGRTDEENESIVKRYKSNALKCLVQVDKAGEGFDNPRSSILVFINNGTSGSNRSKQHFGRGFRRNYGIENFEDDVCDIFVSSDSDLVSLVKTLEWDTRRRDWDWGDDDGDDSDPNDRFYDIPDLIVVKTKLNYTEMVEPLGNIQEAARKLREMDPGRFGHRSDDDLIAAVSAAMYARKAEYEKLSEAETLEQIRDQVKIATNQLINQAAKMRYGKNMPKEGVKKIAIAINGKWKDDHLPHEEMTKAEFHRKHKWVQQINNTIKAERSLQSFPWLMT